MGLYRELDWWSISDKLEQILAGQGNECFRNSEYAGYYDELLTEMANAAGDVWNEFEKIKHDIYLREIPWKTRKYAEEGEETENAAWWFDTAALALEETNAAVLFDREDIFTDYEKEKQKRLNMLERLTKKDFLWLVQAVSSLIIRFLELDGAWEAIKGAIDELDSRQAFIKDKGGLKEPKAAYL